MPPHAVLYVSVSCASGVTMRNRRGSPQRAAVIFDDSGGAVALPVVVLTAEPAEPAAVAVALPAVALPAVPLPAVALPLPVVPGSVLLPPHAAATTTAIASLVISPPPSSHRDTSCTPRTAAVFSCAPPCRCACA